MLGNVSNSLVLAKDSVGLQTISFRFSFWQQKEIQMMNALAPFNHDGSPLVLPLVLPFGWHAIIHQCPISKHSPHLNNQTQLLCKAVYFYAVTLHAATPKTILHIPSKTKTIIVL